MARTSLTLRLPDDLHVIIKGLADASERSFNSQIIHMVRHSLNEMQLSTETWTCCCCDVAQWNMDTRLYKFSGTWSWPITSDEEEE